SRSSRTRASTATSGPRAWPWARPGRSATPPRAPPDPTAHWWPRPLRAGPPVAASAPPAGGLVDTIFNQAFIGLSQASILLLIALGLTFTFGQMGVINM